MDVQLRRVCCQELVYRPAVPSLTSMGRCDRNPAACESLNECGDCRMHADLASTHRAQCVCTRARAYTHTARGACLPDPHACDNPRIHSETHTPLDFDHNDPYSSKKVQQDGTQVLDNTPASTVHPRIVIPVHPRAIYKPAVTAYRQAPGKLASTTRTGNKKY